MITTQDYVQALLHRGRIFDIRRLHPSTATLANGAFSDILVITGAKALHAYPRVKAIGTMEIYGYKDTEYSATGTEILPANRHYQNGYDLTVLSKFYHSPTGVTPGTEIYTDIVPAGGTQGAQSSGAETSFEDGYVLGPEGVYLLRVKNVSGAAAIAHLTITAHEQRISS